MRFTQLNIKLHQAAVCLLTCGITAITASADIYEWEYIDPLQPELGKQASTTLVPDGAGVDAVPGASLYSMDLSHAYFGAVDLSDANFRNSNLTDAYFRSADLADALFSRSDFTGADLSDASIQRTEFAREYPTNLTYQQLASTSSYQAKNLGGVKLSFFNFDGVDLSGYNLSGAVFDNSSWSGTDLTNANIRQTSLVNASVGGMVSVQFYSTASYQSGDLAGVNMFNCNCSGWDFTNADLTGASFFHSDLNGADYSNANLTDVSFRETVTTDINLTNATIVGSNLSKSGISQQALMSTASFQAADLSQVNLQGLDLTDADLSGFNLDGVVFTQTGLTGVDMTGASILGANFYRAMGYGLTEQMIRSTASYTSGSLRGVSFHSANLSGWDFSGLDLIDVDFDYAYLEGADFTDAWVRGAILGATTRYDGTGLNEQMLKSTASYKVGDLSGVSFFGNRMQGWDLSGQNLSETDFGRVYMHNMNLKDTDLNGALPTSQVMSGTDMRRAVNTESFLPANAHWLDNLIHPDGTMRKGLVTAGFGLQEIWFRDDDGGEALTPMPIIVQAQFDIESDAILRFLIEDPSWGSTILFDPSVGTAHLAGTLELAMTLDDGLTPAELLGATLDLFDWTGVTIDGAFDSIVLDPAWYAAGLGFDVSQLMTTGEVHVVPLIGDLNADGFVGIDDLNIVLTGWNQNVIPGDIFSGDVDGDGFIGIVDLNLVLGTWNASVPPPASHAAAVPEPGAVVLMGVSVFTRLCCRPRHKTAA